MQLMEHPPVPADADPDVVNAEFGTPEEVAERLHYLVDKARRRRDRGELARSPEYL